MIYDTSNELDKNRAIEKFKYLISKGKIIELKEKRKIRSLSQNRYLHLILSWYALEMGETLEYTKREVFKREVNPDIFIYEYVNRKTGEIREELRSTSLLNTKETTTVIDRFRNFASINFGIYLPEPQDLVSLREMERQIENQKQYL